MGTLRSALLHVGPALSLRSERQEGLLQGWAAGALLEWSFAKIILLLKFILYNPKIQLQIQKLA